MKLTKQQRHDVYKKALEFAYELKKNGGSIYLCDCLRRSGPKEMLKINFDDIILQYPEVLAKKPVDACYAWFGMFDYKPRIKILKQCIKETE